MGDEIDVTLHSTYWSLDPPSNPAVLVTVGQPAYQHPSDCPSIPGTGCGTVTQAYRAAAAGSSTITASRQSCGEAMACGPDQSRFAVAVTVVAGQA